MLKRAHLRPLQGFKLSGNNHSDDLFMLGTNAQKNCVGVGGAPGESVWIKAGATRVEPKAVNDGAAWIILSTESGFEAATTIYFMAVEVAATKLN